MTTVDLRPLSLGEVLDRTFTLYRSHFWLFVGIMALPHVVNVVLNLLIQGILGPVFALPPGLDPQKAGLGEVVKGGGYFVAVLLSGLVGWVLYSLALGATTTALSDVYFDRRATIRGAYRKVQGRLWALMGVTFAVMVRFVGLAALFFVVFFLLIAIPAAVIGRGSPIVVAVIGLLFFALTVAAMIVIMLRYAVAIPALLLENIKARQALKRSVLLTKGQKARLFLIFFLMLLMAYVVILILQWPLWTATALIAQKSRQVPVWLSSLTVVAGGIGGALSGPLLMIGFSLLYYDVRIRKEAFDLQMMLSALEPVAPPRETPPAVTGA